MQEIAEIILQKLVKTTNSDVSIFIEKTTSTRLIVENCVITVIETLTELVATLTVIESNKKVTCTVNNFSEEAINDAINNLISKLSTTHSSPYNKMARGAGSVTTFGKISSIINVELLFSGLETFLDRNQAEFSNVLIDSGVLQYRNVEKLYYNNLGVNYLSSNSFCELQLLLLNKVGNEKISDYFVQLFKSIDELEKVELNNNFRLIAERINNPKKEILLKVPFKGDIIMAPNFTQSIFNGLTNLLRDNQIVSGNSFLKNKLGKTISSIPITLLSRPRDTFQAVEEYFSDDGYLLENEIIIEKGVLNQFLLTDFGARMLEISRSHSQGVNLSISPGKLSLSEQINSMEEGLILTNYSGGGLSANGDFSGISTNCAFVLKGRIEGAISNISISGNIAKLLFELDSISENICNDGFGSWPWLMFKKVSLKIN